MTANSAQLEPGAPRAGSTLYPLPRERAERQIGLEIGLDAGEVADSVQSLQLQ